MQIQFRVLGLSDQVSSKLREVVQLKPGNWDDYSFKTSFDATYIDVHGNRIELGTLKIGYVDQPKGWTREKIPAAFESLPDGWFSLGQDVDYYKTVRSSLKPELCAAILLALKDVVNSEELLVVAANELVFRESLTRGVGLSTIKDQFKRVLNGQAELTDFHFSYAQDGNEKNAAVAINFRVSAGSTPSSNVHVLIGRNGVGKTTLLNNMVRTLMQETKRESEPLCQFHLEEEFLDRKPLPHSYFSNVVSVSFSAFDPFLPPPDQQDRSQGPAFFYIGMKNARSGAQSTEALTPKTSGDLVNDFVSSFKSCLSQPAKKARWLTAIRRLASDSNFADMALERLIDLDDKEAARAAGAIAGRMSSGHSIVLLTITKLVDTVQEKALVLIDEPESHLHPPLLSAFTRALSDLLHDRNGVAIVATHSPVVLQEVPRSCVWKLTRIRAQGRSDRPERETFGENVGILTREVFGLEVSKSGFHEILQHSVDAGGSYESICGNYRDQLGTEARAILLTLIANRDASSEFTQ
ncbi:AAA family ATPase [Rhodoferax sp.]|uniref:AAA family ATPase n=1 Tax=Rhodoferax sp. TaxID=50421 RepID=UPI0025D10E0E|nr:AAA family ATPase [Rhodoferax sp.]MCM2339801.1 AAA family ATPase [Rhodoferax sp.]